MRVHAPKLICSTGVLSFQTFKLVFCMYNKLHFNTPCNFKLVGSCKNEIKSNLFNTYQIMLVFEERGKPEYPEKTSQTRVENQQTQPTCGAGSGNRTWPHWGGGGGGGGECCHHYGIPPAPPCVSQSLTSSYPQSNPLMSNQSVLNLSNSAP